MAKRKQAKNKGRFALVRGLARSTGELVARNPSIAGATTVFGITFAFVAINALAYQPGKHPAPLYETRQPAGYSIRVPDIDEVPVPSSRVTTYRIEHSDPQSTASIPDAAATPANETVLSLQRAMHSRGWFRGDVDGVFGPQTANAIRAYQKAQGLEVDGKPTDALLVHLMISNMDAVVVPQAKPQAQTQAPKRTQTQPQPKPKAKAPRNVSVAPVQKPAPKASDTQSEPSIKLVLDIQRGLSNIAYGNVQVDGVIGKQTSEAIADFQRHYRLPVTGQPDRVVLQKLRDIGAL